MKSVDMVLLSCALSIGGQTGQFYIMKTISANELKNQAHSIFSFHKFCSFLKLYPLAERKLQHIVIIAPCAGAHLAHLQHVLVGQNDMAGRGTLAYLPGAREQHGILTL